MHYNSSGKKAKEINKKNIIFCLSQSWELRAKTCNLLLKKIFFILSAKPPFLQTRLRHKKMVIKMNFDVI